MNIINDEELLSRYIFTKKHIRSSDNTIKGDAFIPPTSSLSTSVTRHATNSEQEIWDIGAKVSAIRKKTLHGKGEIKSKHVRKINLDVLPTPSKPPELNPHHADIIKWPTEKEDRKEKAFLLARESVLKCK